MIYFATSLRNFNLAIWLQVEIMVPGPKVGLIIGKGGETIKQLQEKSGAKMVVIQDGPAQEQEKPLRISGDPQKVEVRIISKFFFYISRSIL